MAGLMYFGNRNRMTWVKCPDTGMGMSRAHWSADGTYLNGGGYVRNSKAGHLVYEMGWNFLNRAQLYAITDYRDGLYGPGSIYFLDPFQMDRNVLPQHWAHPALAGEDAQPLTDQRPSVQSLTVTRRNVVQDPRARLASGWSIGGLGTGGPTAPETMITGATDGPTLPDGTKVTTYTRYTLSGPTATGGAYILTGQTSGGNYQGDFPVGTGTGTSMYMRTSVASQWYPRRWTYLAGASVGASQGPPVMVPANTWVNLGFFSTITQAADYLRASVIATGALAGGQIIDVTCGMVDVGASRLEPYFDGDLPSTPQRTNSWVGTVNQSASLQVVQRNPLTALNAPPQSATYTLTSATTFKKVWIPVPDGYTFHVGGLYSRTGTANVKVVTDLDATVELTPDMDPAPHVIPSKAISNTGGGVTLSLTGVGTISLVGLMAQVLPNGRVPTLNTFASGQGNSGSEFASDPTVTGYSAVRDHMALSVTLKEVGAWDE